MDYASAYRGEDKQTVQLRVQVVGLNAFTLDLRLPTFLPTRDVTQRIARDAGLEAHWETGERRLYHLRARGRLLGPDEKLEEVGVINGELVYLLPQPPVNSGVVEQDPDYPVTHDYAGSGIPALLVNMMLIVTWSIAWGAALSVREDGWHTIWLSVAPGLGLGILSGNFARHAWGGESNRVHIVLTALVLLYVMFPLTFTVAWGLDLEAFGGFFGNLPVTPPRDLGLLFIALTPGIIAGTLAVFIGWLAWWGAVNPLPVRKAAPVEAPVEAAPTAACGICGGGVTPDVQMACPYNCGQAFHVGCHRARVAVYRGDARFCAICNQRVS